MQPRVDILTEKCSISKKGNRPAWHKDMNERTKQFKNIGKSLIIARIQQSLSQLHKILSVRPNKWILCHVHNIENSQ